MSYLIDILTALFSFCPTGAPPLGCLWVRRAVWIHCAEFFGRQAGSRRICARISWASKGLSSTRVQSWKGGTEWGIEPVVGVRKQGIRTEICDIQHTRCMLRRGRMEGMAQVYYDVNKTWTVGLFLVSSLFLSLSLFLFLLFSFTFSTCTFIHLPAYFESLHNGGRDAGLCSGQSHLLRLVSNAAFI